MSTCELDRFVIQTPYIKVVKSCSAPRGQGGGEERATTFPSEATKRCSLDVCRTGDLSPLPSPLPLSRVACRSNRSTGLDRLAVRRRGGGGGRLSSLAAEKLTPVNFSKRGVHCFGTHVFSSSLIERETERDSVLYLLQLKILIIGIECLSFLWNLDYYSLIRISTNIDRTSEWLCINLLSKFEPID